MGNPRAQWQGLMNERAPIYEGVSHFVCDVDHKSVDEIVSEIEIAYELRSKGDIHG
jgi:shikimate kinase